MLYVYIEKDMGRTGPRQFIRHPRIELCIIAALTERPPTLHVACSKEIMIRIFATLQLLS